MNTFAFTGDHKNAPAEVGGLRKRGHTNWIRTSEPEHLSGSPAPAGQLRVPLRGGREPVPAWVDVKGWPRGRHGGSGRPVTGSSGSGGAPSHIKLVRSSAVRIGIVQNGGEAEVEPLPCKQWSRFWLEPWPWNPERISNTGRSRMSISITAAKEAAVLPDEDP